MLGTLDRLSERPQTRWLCAPGRGSAAAVDDDQVGHETGDEPDGQHPEAELAMSVAAHRVPDLADHVEDRAPGDRIERQLERLGCDVVAEHRPEESRASADEPGDGEPAPRRPDVAER